jgi:predicted AAA+ superfamily ATPase
LKLAIDADRGRGGRFLLTGSQSFSLMAGVSESLAGRAAVLELLPLSWTELGPHAAGRTLAEVLWQGAYPEPALHPRRRDLWVRSYVATYLERDVRQLANITNMRAFSQLVSLLAARHGGELNRAELARDCGVSQPTANAWIGVMEASYVLTLLPPYFENLGKRVVRSPKVYLLDSALVCDLTRQPAPEAALAGALGGALLEGWVVNEARKAFTHSGRRPAIFFWRSHDGLEVDLLVEAGGRVHLIEVKATATPTAQHGAPIRRLALHLGDRAGHRIVVCRVDSETRLPGGVLAIPWSAFPGLCRAWVGEAS